MKALFLIGAVAKRPRPVRERPIRKALLRAISGMYDDSRPCNHIGAGARLISQPSPPVRMSCRAALVIIVKARAKLEFAQAGSCLAAGTLCPLRLDRLPPSQLERE